MYKYRKPRDSRRRWRDTSTAMSGPVCYWATTRACTSAKLACYGQPFWLSLDQGRMIWVGRCSDMRVSGQIRSLDISTKTHYPLVRVAMEIGLNLSPPPTVPESCNPTVYARDCERTWLTCVIADRRCDDVDHVRSLQTR